MLSACSRNVTPVSLQNSPLEMLDRIGTAFLHDLFCPPFPFAGVKTPGTGNGTDANANQRSLFLTRYVLPEPHHEPPA